MKKLIALPLFVLALSALQSSAVEINVGVGGGHRTNYYDTKANAWTEGTIETVGPDGRVTLKGYDSPYAANYSSYHRDYYALPEAERETRAKEINERYKDKLTYERRNDGMKDYSFSVGDRDNFKIYDESSRYGRSSDSWKYSEPHTYKYSDLKTGDRVVVGYDSNNPGNAHTVYHLGR